MPPEELLFPSAQCPKGRFGYERMLAVMSSLALEATEKDAFFKRCITLLGRELKVSLVRLCGVEPSGRRITYRYEWTAIDGKSREIELKGDSVEILGWDISPLMQADMLEWKEGAGGAAVKRENRKLKALLAVPLFIGDGFWGFIGLEDHTQGRQWTQQDKLALQAAAEIILRGKEMLDLYASYSDLDLAFSELLRQRGNDLQELEERIVTNLRTLIEPGLARLRRSRLTLSQKKWLDAIENHLDQIVSPLTTRLSSNAYGLTRAEIQVAEFIRQGKSSKEIAGLTGTSIRTIQVHRVHIRRKFKLKRWGGNLKVFLQTMK